MPPSRADIHDVGAVQQLGPQSTEHLVPTTLEVAVLAGSQDHAVGPLPAVSERQPGKPGLMW
eukprot:2695173-Pyramimonas_sp.AAC.1